VLYVALRAGWRVCAGKVGSSILLSANDRRETRRSAPFQSLMSGSRAARGTELLGIGGADSEREIGALGPEPWRVGVEVSGKFPCQRRTWS
jgi:hypothetical protein